MRRTLTAIGALVTGLVPAVALAQDPFTLDEIVFAANLDATEAARTGASFSIITREELEKAGKTRVADVLDGMSGISVASDGGLGAATNVRVRGLSGQRYLGVRIDGIDVTDPSLGQTGFDFGRLTTAGIGRVEVIKGSQSALYGSEAIAGVIDISTNRATENGTVTSVEAEGGSYDTLRGSLNVSTLADRGEMALTLSRVQTNGFSAADENQGNTEDDGFEATRLSFTGAYDLTDTLRVGASGFYEDSEVEFDEFGGDGTPDEETEGETWGLRGFADLTTGAVTHTFAASYFENDRHTTGTTAFGTTNSRFVGDRVELSYKGLADLGESLKLVFGGDWTDEGFDTSTNTGSQITRAVFAQALLAATDTLDLSVAARLDDHSGFGSRVTGRASAAWRPAEGWVLRAVAGTGFRAPSLFERFDSQFGNPGLKEETSVSYELGVERHFDNGGNVKLTAFYTEIDDLIEFVTLTTFPNPFTGQFRQVPGTTETSGVELSGRLPIGERIALFGNYTYTEAETAAGPRLLRVPRHDLLLGAEADVTDRLAGRVTVQYVADLLDIGTPAELPDYTVVDASLTYAVTDEAEVYFRIENLFDEEYQVVRGFGTSDRAFYAGVRASF
ncbi:TonB-dependent receptor [Maritimibacter sp. 55A14]|uniref:TonB-dependent receptor plug domain-containing protein n=1 Tax=Maritimibacter sp. 55A14 TaxID=2174844 RepID=UPI000D607368|nr:TonB-dependent receptor [Maritimibacter sp. 55A14]PWE33264.1 TonB-dependent receptor [Maritimibacter sp. 55A14]